MILARTLLASLLLFSAGPQSVFAGKSGGARRQRKPVPADVRKAAAEYANAVLDAIRLLREEHIKKVPSVDLAGWAIEGLYKRWGERIPPEILKRLSELHAGRKEDLRRFLIDARQHLGRRPRRGEYHDLDSSLAGIAARLDPGMRIRSRLQGSLIGEPGIRRIGIGAEVRKEAESGLLQIATPYRESGAYRAGLRAGDIITRIIQDRDEENRLSPWSISTKDLTLAQAQERLRGPIGSKIKLTVYRDDPSKPKEVVVTRKGAARETVFGCRRKADDSWDYLYDRRARIAYIRIAEFTRRTRIEVRRTLLDLKRRRVRGVVLDIRGNPGGLLDGALDSAALFLDKTPLVTFRIGSGEEERILNEIPGRFRRTSLVCLIDGETGRAAEIFAACLQDHHRAIVIGERSRGDAAVQTLRLFHERWLQFTTVAFYRPNGKPLSKILTSGSDNEDWGVRPDRGLNVKLAQAERKDRAAQQRRVEIIAPFNRFRAAKVPAFWDRQLEKALEYLRGKHSRGGRAL